MKKAFLLCLAVMPLISCASDPSSGFYVGGGIGHYNAKFEDGNVGVIQDIVGTTETIPGSKKSLAGNSWGGSLFIGKLFEGNKLDWLIQGGISFDTTALSHEFSPSAQNPTGITVDRLKLKVRRMGTLDATTGLSKVFGKGFRASVTVGILLSRFNVKFIETPENAEDRLEKSVYTWGIAPGVSLEKSVGPVRLGLSYHYQMLETLKIDKGTIVNTPTLFSMQQKPFYHVAMITVKKTF